MGCQRDVGQTKHRIIGLGRFGHEGIKRSAAQVPGFLTITVPLLLPAFVATGLICAVLAFNEFIFASTMTFSPDSRTLTVGISLFQGERFVNFGQMAAASLTGMIPVYFIAMFVQKWLIGGLAQGSIK